MVDPTNLQPRRWRSFDRTSEAGVVAGMSPPTASSGSLAGGGGTIVVRYASNEPNSSAMARNARALPIVASILARLRTIPASAISRARTVSRLRRMVDHRAQARDVPGGVRRLRPDDRRGLRRRGPGTADGRRRDR